MTEKIKGYHYTNSRNHKSIQTKGIDGYTTLGFDDFRGLIPSRRFLKIGRGNGLPSEASDGVIEGLLEPEPESWTNNPEFPCFWVYFMNDICRGDKIMLLDFDILPTDKAFIVDRAHIERELYREAMGRGKSTKATMDIASKKYFDSRTPVYDYSGGYNAPQLAIWSPIEFDRLNIKWIRDCKEVWEEAKRRTQ